MESQLPTLVNFDASQQAIDTSRLLGYLPLTVEVCIISGDVRFISIPYKRTALELDQSMLPIIPSLHPPIYSFFNIRGESSPWSEYILLTSSCPRPSDELLEKSVLSKGDPYNPHILEPPTPRRERKRERIRLANQPHDIPNFTSLV